MKFDFKKVPLYFLVSFVLALVLFVLLVGISFWLFVFFTLWGLFYLVFIGKIIRLTFLKYEWIWIFFGILILLTLGLIFLTKDSVKKTSTSSEKPLTAEECAPIAEKYDGKILNVSSDGLKGRVAIQITDRATCKAKIVHQYLFAANLENDSQYGYMGYTTEKDDQENRQYWYGNGSIAPAYQNKDQLPANPYEIGSSYYGGGNGNSDTFYSSYSEEPYLTENRYQEILDEEKLYVLGDASFVIVTNEGEGMSSSTGDDERAAKEGPIVKIFNLTFSE